MAGLTITVQYLLLMCIVWGAWFHWMLLADQGDCRRLKFVLPVDGKRLESHIFLNLSIGIYTQCEHRCAMESRCVSVNIGPSKENDKVTCELNDADHLQFPDDLKDHPGWTYRGTENPCSGRNPCFHNGTCMSGYSDKRFICLCPAGYTGEHCEQAVLAASCKEQYEKHSSNKSQVYQLMVDSQKIPVYCHMGDFGCGNGGWTLAMKIDGAKKTFHYDSSFWSNRNAYNLAGGKTGFDAQQTKLPTYWNTSFSKICLGMKIGKQIRFLVINKQAQSLYALIADGKYRATSLVRNKWKTLVGSRASLQANCNREGFNAVADGKAGYSRARIGILGNNENDCKTPDSRIGFGTGGYSDDSNTCGDNGHDGKTKIKAMGYILVQ